jgi:hypothetical protein
MKQYQYGYRFSRFFQYSLSLKRFSLPQFYKMTLDYLGILALSMPFEVVNLEVKNIFKVKDQVDTILGQKCAQDLR